MADHFRDIPPLRTLPYMMPAAHYNPVKLALLRLGSPLELELPKLGLALVLDRRFWLGLSLWQELLPMIEWTRFDTRGRRGLDQPVACELRFYHVHAGLLVRPALEALDEALRERLAVSGRA